MNGFFYYVIYTSFQTNMKMLMQYLQFPSFDAYANNVIIYLQGGMSNVSFIYGMKKFGIQQQSSKIFSRSEEYRQLVIEYL